MVVFVGHTLLLRSIRLDIDNVSDMVVDEESRQLNGAVICITTQCQYSSNSAQLLIAPLKPRLNMWRVRAR